MGKISLPETVKTTIEEIVNPAVGAISGLAFDVSLGPNEVMVLLSLFYYHQGTDEPAAGVNGFFMGLWRKTDTNPPYPPSVKHSDMVWNMRGNLWFVAESIKNTESQHIIFPWPVVLIRPPRLIASRIGTMAAISGMRLYYIIQEITDEELAQLMVKDHA